MLCYLEASRDRVLVMARAETEDGEIVGDAHWPIRPGEDFFGIGYDELRVKADAFGVIDIPELP